MTDAIDQLGADWLEEVEQTSETPEEPVVETAPELEPVETPEPIEDVETVETAKPETVPLATLQAERKRRQELERRVQEIEAAKPQAPIPDAYEDPVGFNQHVQSQIEQVRWETKAEMSGFQAEQKFGKPLVEEAIAWAQEQSALDPTLNLKVRQSASPVEFVVQEYQQSRTLQTLAGRSFEDAARDHAIAQGWIVSPEVPSSAQPDLKPSSPKPPRGLAKTPGTGIAAPKDADWSEVKFALG